MSGLWSHYVFRRGPGVHGLWDRLFEDRPIRLLYVAGRGFDTRVKYALDRFLYSIEEVRPNIQSARLLLVESTDYELSEGLKLQTEKNATEMKRMFASIGEISELQIGTSLDKEELVSATTALRIGTDNVLGYIDNHTDVILDVSSLPRVVYLALMMGFLHRFIPDKSCADPLHSNGINFQILVAEDSALDAKIRSEDPSDDLVLIPGFGAALYAESEQDKTIVWFPLLGENRTSQFDKVGILANIPESAEICPVLPHPSRYPRRADDLVREYREDLFQARKVPTANILYAHESNPFEAYRQLLGAMERYRESLLLLGGCRLLVTPLSSKLMTVAAGLACFEMKPTSVEDAHGVAIPYAEPKRYVASQQDLDASNPELTVLLLTGIAYARKDSFS